MLLDEATASEFVRVITCLMISTASEFVRVITCLVISTKSLCRCLCCLLGLLTSTGMTVPPLQLWNLRLQNPLAYVGHCDSPINLGQVFIIQMLL